jgi:hypothetical protein
MGNFSGRLHRIGSTNGIAVTGGMVDESDGLRQRLRGTLTAPEGTTFRSGETFSLQLDHGLTLCLTISPRASYGHLVPFSVSGQLPR